MDKCVVNLNYGTYESTQTVWCDPDDDNEQIIAKAWAQVKQWLTLPMASRSAKIISRESSD